MSFVCSANFEFLRDSTKYGLNFCSYILPLLSLFMNKLFAVFWVLITLIRMYSGHLFMISFVFACINLGTLHIFCKS